MITRSLASEWAPYKINVNAIAPFHRSYPFFRSHSSRSRKTKTVPGQLSVGQGWPTGDIVGACVFLASPASDFITGQIIYLDGGLTAIG